MAKIIDLKLPPKSSDIHTYFIAADLHAHKLHVPTFDIMCKHADLISSPALIINGDLFELEYMMKRDPNYAKWKNLSGNMDEFFIPKWEEEISFINRILDEAQKHFVKIIFLLGNHSQPRIDEFLRDVCPLAYRGNFSIEDKLKLKQRNIPMINYNDWLEIGDMRLTHGEFSGVSALKKHQAMSSSKSVVIGHIHKLSMMPFRQVDGTNHAWSLPCMSELNPHWLKSKSNDWDLGYAILQVKSTGKFNFYPVINNDNDVILPCGKRIKSEREIL